MPSHLLGCLGAGALGNNREFWNLKWQTLGRNPACLSSLFTPGAINWILILELTITVSQEFSCQTSSTTSWHFSNFALPILPSPIPLIAANTSGGSLLPYAATKISLFLSLSTLFLPPFSTAPPTQLNHPPNCFLTGMASLWRDAETLMTIAGQV